MMSMPISELPRTLVWFRRDLRDYDHTALQQALSQSGAVYALFVFDSEILEHLPRNDRRVEFIWHSLWQLKMALISRGGDLKMRHGRPLQVVPELARELRVQAVYANHDHEPAAQRRDQEVAVALADIGVAFHRYKDQLIFEGREILTQAGQPYTVFTPYSRAWRVRLNAAALAPYTIEHWQRLAPVPAEAMPSLAEIGFQSTNLLALGVEPGMHGAEHCLQDFLPRLADYAVKRDFPVLDATSRLSVHLRFGTVSIRELVGVAVAHGSHGADVWLNELIWREFYAQILANFPRVTRESFKAAYADLVYPGTDDDLQAWCQGRTGYPLVDAGMRQLNQTGFMHNRLRMVCASFLCKHLLVDWRRGEAYFAEKLLDFELASNNGGWQWAASTGCDAQPYFRIFNPVTQSQKFDGAGRFIRQYVSELAPLPDRYLHTPWLLPPMQQQLLGVVLGHDYPLPVVNHEQARQAALALYQRG